MTERGFYSAYFLVPKKMGNFRHHHGPLTSGHTHCPQTNLHAEYQAANGMGQPDDWFTATDLKDVYFHFCTEKQKGCPPAGFQWFILENTETTWNSHFLAFANNLFSSSLCSDCLTLEMCFSLVLEKKNLNIIKVNKNESPSKRCSPEDLPQVMINIRNNRQVRRWQVQFDEPKPFHLML